MRRARRAATLAATLAAALAAALLLRVARAEDARVGLSVSDGSAQLAAVARGVQQALDGRALPIGPDGADGGGLRIDPLVRVIVAVGSAAERAVRRAAGALPVVGCATLTATAPGVELEHAFETQFATLRRLLPGASRVGALYHGAGGQRRFEAAAQAARRAGLALVPMPVDDVGAVGAALEQAAATIDAIWTLPDPAFLTAQSGRLILLFSLRQQLPFIGPAANWVKAGALYALDWDYEDVGRQCGELAGRLLAGRAAPAAGASPPRRAALVINARSASHLKIALPPAVLQSATQVYE